MSSNNSFINVIHICYRSLKKKKKILFFGNGGSAADAQHLATELTVDRLMAHLLAGGSVPIGGSV